MPRKLGSDRDLDRIYWSLVINGPQTLYELQLWTNWTKARTNDACQILKRSGCVKLTEHDRHKGAPWFNSLTRRGARMRCGKWVAIQACAVGEIVDAELVPA